MMRLWLSLALVVILAATPALAQERVTRRIEIGGGFSGLASFVSDGGPYVLGAAGPSVTLNITPRLGIELASELIGGAEGAGTTGFYLTQLKLPFRESRDGQRMLSFTVGTGGVFTYSHRREIRITRLDGSIVVHPDYRRFRVSRPNIISAGITQRQMISRYASVSLGVHGFIGEVGVALRGAVGVSFGRYR